MADTHQPASQSGAPAIDAHADGHYKSYWTIFIVLCVATGTSFLANLLLGQGMSSAVIIMIVSIIKAACVAVIFMHLKQDWKLVYGIMLPVCIMAVMTILVLLPDTVFAWSSVRGMLFGIGD